MYISKYVYIHIYTCTYIYTYTMKYVYIYTFIFFYVCLYKHPGVHQNVRRGVIRTIFPHFSAQNPWCAYDWQVSQWPSVPPLLLSFLLCMAFPLSPCLFSSSNPNLSPVYFQPLLQLFLLLQKLSIFSVILMSIRLVVLPFVSFWNEGCMSELEWFHDSNLHYQGVYSTPPPTAFLCTSLPRPPLFCASCLFESGPFEKNEQHAKLRVCDMVTLADERRSGCHHTAKKTRRIEVFYCLNS